MASPEKKTERTKILHSTKETSTAPALKTELVGFSDNRSETTQLKDIQKMANTGARSEQIVQMKKLSDGHSVPQSQVIQKKNGSHGKTKKLNVQGTYTDGGAPVAFNDRDENISIVKGHEGYTDELALAEAWVKKAYRLSANAVVTITKYNFFTAK